MAMRQAIEAVRMSPHTYLEKLVAVQKTEADARALERKGSKTDLLLASELRKTASEGARELGLKPDAQRHMVKSFVNSLVARFRK